MNESNYTSLWLSEKLKEGGCEVEWFYGWYKLADWGDIKRDRRVLRYRIRQQNRFTNSYDFSEKIYPAFDILNDICVKHREKFFKSENGCIYVRDQYGCEITETVLVCIQRGDKQAAEEYIWENCVFNPDNRSEK